MQNPYYRNDNIDYSGARIPFRITCLLAIMLSFLGCSVYEHAPSSAMDRTNNQVEDKWGVRVESIRLSAAGHLVDFRYRVTNPEKAATLMKRGGEAYLLDMATGTKLPVPVTKVGQLRGTGTTPQENRVYTVMFNSGNGIVQRGSLVSVVIGDFKAQHLTVE